MSAWPQELESLLDYEVRSSNRNRRFASLVMIDGWNGGRGYAGWLRGTIRESDAVFECESGMVVLMGETDRAGALKAVKRYKSNCAKNLDVRFAVSSYPEDGQSAPALLRSVQDRMQRAKALCPHSVVSRG